METKVSKIRVCIYCRVSTSKQDTDHQLRALRGYAKKMGYEVVKEFTETISGSKKINDRIALVELMDFVKENNIDKILIFECSRLSRRASDFLYIIEQMNELSISIFVYQNNMETLLEDKTPNPLASLVVGVIAQFNQMERSMIRARMSAGYDNFRAKGGKVGRKETYRKSDFEYLSDYSYELDLIKKDLTLKEICKLSGRSINTIRKLRDKFYAAS